MSTLLPPEHAKAIAAFDQVQRTRLVFGNGSAANAGELIAELGLKRILLVTDPGLIRAGHVAKLCAVLETAGLEVVLFDSVIENPTTECVERCRRIAEESKVDSFLGLGGGSSMDTAKGANFLLTNGGRMQDYWGVGKAQKEMLPLIVIPTTAGTGSECQSFALISDAETHQKMACGDPKAAARIAILDPELTLSQPRNVTACTGIDAIAHAVETAVTNKKNELSWMFSKEAFGLLMPHFPTVLNHPDDLNARGSMLLGAAMAGCAIEASMLGAAHSTANPLTAHYDIVHGQAVGMMMPHVVRFNAEDCEAREAYAELAVIGKLIQSRTGDEPTEHLAKRLIQLLEMADMPVMLKASGVEESMLPTLAVEAAEQWTANFNPRVAGQAEMETIYRAAF
ncbi:MAG TPA: alcohol dehydrogenase [Verrucomicrobiales bacterium]|jgi:alcohol dehydrogenase|nr:alcohol dehydrogenase [Verrucomicrobiales bacterium]HAH98410.1 alcohol dehydrogenase [Verrucomicrobiales bacterium]|tara:strand:+ start:2818 stop:4008 length:1191 start_codon:yes stop_codon:yes gene_type:complete